MEGKRLMTLEAVRRFVFGGKARVTLVSAATGQRFTYRITMDPEGNKPTFVSVLTGSDNESDYTYLGAIFRDGYRRTRASRIGAEADSAKAWDWFYRALCANVLPHTVEVWHEGRCGRCGRTLTVPSSIEHGFGPECVKHVGLGV